MTNPTTILDYSNDLASWNNQDPQKAGDTHYLYVTVVTNGLAGPARLFEGSVVGTTRHFLGRADEWLFTAQGTMLSTEVDGTLRKASFGWISNAQGGHGVLAWVIPPNSFYPSIADGKKGVQIDKIQLVDGLLIGVGMEPSTNQPVKCIISFRKVDETPPVVK